MVSYAPIYWVLSRSPEGDPSSRSSQGSGLGFSIILLRLCHAVSGSGFRSLGLRVVNGHYAKWFPLHFPNRPGRSRGSFP